MTGLSPQIVLLKDVLSIPTIEYYDSISSTNDRIKEMLETSVLPELPCLVVAASQTAGRGRGQKAWWSGRGALLMSFGLDLNLFSLSRKDLPLLSLTTGLSVTEALRNRLASNPVFSKHTIGIHWPNDVYVDEKKICGILIEAPRAHLAAIGIGVNVNNRSSDIPEKFQGEFRKRPVTSLIDILDEKTDISSLIVDIWNRFQYNVDKIGKRSSELIQAVEAVCVQIGRNVAIDRNGQSLRGRCLALEPDGSLRLRTDHGIETVSSGIVQCFNEAD